MAEKENTLPLEFVQVTVFLDKIESGELSAAPFLECGAIVSEDLHSAFDQILRDLFALHRAAIQAQVVTAKHHSNGELPGSSMDERERRETNEQN